MKRLFLATAFMVGLLLVAPTAAQDLRHSLASIMAQANTWSGQQTFVAPVLGAATATSVNKLTLTAPATSATLTLANSSSLITSGAYAVTLTASGTTGVTLPTSGTLASVLSGTTASIGGGLLAAIGNCTSGVATVTGALVGQPVIASTSDGSVIDGLVRTYAYVSATDTVTVQLCAMAAVTPVAKTWNVRIFP